MLELLPYQQSLVSDEARFTWNCWARQTGKSTTLGLRRLMRAVERKRLQVILSAGERQSREVMEKIRHHCRSLSIYYEWCEESYFKGTQFRQLELRLSGGVRIIGLPANPTTARGFSGDVFLDEFAMHRDAEEIWAALFPTVLRGEGEVDVASTPRGQKNEFFQLKDREDFAKRTVTLADAVSHGLSVDAELMRRSIGDEWVWRQEFCCEFLDEATSFLTYELIRSCQDDTCKTDVDWNLLASRDAELYIGVDVGRHRDLTAIWLWQRLGESLVTRGLEVLRDAPFDEQEAALDRLLRHRSVRRVCIDATGMGLHLAERLTARYGDDRIQRVVFTAALKGELAGRLRVSAERGLLSIPVDDRIVEDWHSLTRAVTSSGGVRFDAARSEGAHADRFWAAALGIHAATAGPRGEAEFTTAFPPRFARDGVW